MSRISISGFKAYDLRGKVPGELNDQVAYRVGRAYAEFVKPKKVIVGRDIRLSSEELAKALEQGLLDSGVDVYDIGLCGTEVVYYATFAHQMDGGVMVTASHNPPDYNGMKFVREGSRPISGDTGLKDIRAIAEAGEFSKALRVGDRFAIDAMPGYLERRARGQRRRGTDRRPARAVPAIQVHKGSARARRPVSERRAEPDARREPSRARRGAAAARCRHGDLVGR
jgi:phosphomannomutase